MAAKDAVDAMGQRFGLPRFSADLVSLCASFIVCGVASAGAEPRPLFSFGAPPAIIDKFEKYIQSHPEELEDGPGLYYGDRARGFWQILRGPDGLIYTPFENDMLVFDDDGNFVRALDIGCMECYCAFAPSGDLLKAHPLFNTIQVFCRDGARKPAIPLKPNAGKEGNIICNWLGFDVASNGHMYRVDRTNQRVQMFSPDGSFVSCFAGERLHYLKLGAEGELFVSETQHRVKVFDKDGHLVRTYGQSMDDCDDEEVKSQQKVALGYVHSPANVAMDRAGSVYVPDSHGCDALGCGYVHVFKRDGTPLTMFPFSASIDVSPYASDTLIAPDGRIYVADSANRRVSVLAFAF